MPVCAGASVDGVVNAVVATNAVVVGVSVGAVDAADVVDVADDVVVVVVAAIVMMMMMMMMMMMLLLIVLLLVLQLLLSISASCRSETIASMRCPLTPPPHSIFQHPY